MLASASHSGEVEPSARPGEVSKALFTAVRERVTVRPVVSVERAVMMEVREGLSRGDQWRSSPFWPMVPSTSMWVREEQL